MSTALRALEIVVGEIVVGAAFVAAVGYLVWEFAPAVADWIHDYTGRHPENSTTWPYDWEVEDD